MSLNVCICRWHSIESEQCSVSTAENELKMSRLRALYGPAELSHDSIESRWRGLCAIGLKLPSNLS